MAGKREAVKADLTKRIIEAAIITFGENGYSRTALKDIAEKAGVSSGVISKYYESKENLFKAAALQVALHGMIDPENIDDLESALFKIIDGVKEVAVSQPERFRFIRTMMNSHDLPEFITKVHEDAFYQSSLCKAICAAQEKGELGAGDPNLYLLIFLRNAIDVLFLCTELSLPVPDNIHFLNIIKYRSSADREAEKQNKIALQERNTLINTVLKAFPFCLLCNLTKNQYHVIASLEYTAALVQESGTYDGHVISCLQGIPDEVQRQRFFELFSRNSVLAAHSAGKDIISYEHLVTYVNEESCWVRSVLLFNADEGEDVTAIFFAKNIENEINDVLDLSLSAFQIADHAETIYMLNVDSGYYSYRSGNPLHTGLNDSNDIVQRDFFSDIKEVASSLIYKEDVPKVLAFLSRENIMNHLAFSDSCEIEYRTAGDFLSWRRMKLVKDGNWGNSYKVLIGIFNINEQRTQELLENDSFRLALDAAINTQRAKNEYIHQLTSNVITPLSNIRQYLEMAASQAGEDTSMAECLEHGLLAISQLTKLLEEADRTVSAEDAVVPADQLHIIQLSDIEAAIGSSIRAFADARGVDYQLTCGSIASKHVCINKPWIDFILLNIISNSIKYTPKGGHVTHRFEQLKDLPDGRAYFRHTIMDDSPAITGEFFMNSTAYYVQNYASPNYKMPDTEPNLSLALRLIEMLGGKIEANTRQIKGSTIQIYIPAKKSTAAEYNAFLRKK